MLNHLLSPLVWIVYDLAVRSSDLVISISDRVAEWNMGLHGLESTVIYPGIEVERFDRVDRNAARAHLGLPEDAVVFVSVSKLHPRKRIDLALKLFEQHPSSETRSAVFLIVGDGPDRGRLERLVTSLQLTNVKFLGEVPDELIRMLYAAADYFIFTALDEPFGLAPLEAKVAGCKILGIESNYPIISWEESTRRVARCLERLLDR
jgi:glycosyltransferase involved in cell wall biosynthesis